MGRPFGRAKSLDSGRWQASYPDPTNPPGQHKRIFAPVTFTEERQARNWLAVQHGKILEGTWRPAPAPSAAVMSFGAYAEKWWTERVLADRTRAEYRSLLDHRILPTFKDRDITKVSVADVKAWHLAQPKDTRTRTAAAYALLRTILGSAVDDELLTINPARIRGAGSAKRERSIRPASLPELEALVAAMEPARYRLLVLFLAWNAVRFGEATELRREDVKITTVVSESGPATKFGTIRVERGVVKLKGSKPIKGPKSEAGRRTVHIPPHLIPMVEEHLRAVPAGGLLFPSPADPTKHLAHSTFHRWFTTARNAAGRPDLRPHDLRHTGAVLAAQTGATLAELMARLGHSTVAAAMRYQHAAGDRDKALAEALSLLAQPRP